MNIYLTELDAICGLHQTGYIYDFHLSGNDLLWVQEKLHVRVGEFAIRECHQFCSRTQKSRRTIVFGIVALYYNIKGILIKHYSYNAPTTPLIIIKKLDEMIIYSQSNTY